MLSFEVESPCVVPSPDLCLQTARIAGVHTTPATQTTLICQLCYNITGVEKVSGFGYFWRRIGGTDPQSRMAMQTESADPSVLEEAVLTWGRQQPGRD